MIAIAPKWLKLFTLKVHKVKMRRSFLSILVFYQMTLPTKATIVPETKHMEVSLLTEQKKIKALEKFYGKDALSLLRVIKENVFEDGKTFIYQILYKGNKFILKEIPPYSTNILFINASLAFREYLLDEGLPIPVLMKTLKNEDYALINKPGGFKIYILEQFIEGNKWNKSKDQIKNMAIMLGKLHSASFKAFNAKQYGEQHQKKKLSNLPIKNSFDRAEHLINIAKLVLTNKNKLNNEEKNFLHCFIHKCQTRITELRNDSFSKGYGEILISLHGDFNPTNIIFDTSNNVIGIIDFDDCCIDNPIHDLAIALMCICYFSFENDQKLGLLNDEYNDAIEYAKVFLSSYFENSFLKPAQLEPYFDEIMEVVAILCSSLYLIKGLHKNYSNLDIFFDHIVDSKYLITKAFKESLPR